jgi:hypothetical protein
MLPLRTLAVTVALVAGCEGVGTPAIDPASPVYRSAKAYVARLPLGAVAASESTKQEAFCSQVATTLKNERSYPPEVSRAACEAAIREFGQEE